MTHSEWTYDDDVVNTGTEDTKMKKTPTTTTATATTAKAEAAKATATDDGKVAGADGNGTLVFGLLAAPPRKRRSWDRAS